MAARLAIYHPPGRLALRANPFGRDVANLGLFHALAVHGGFEQIDILSQQAVTAAELSEDLALGDAAVRLTTGSLLDQAPALAAGALLRGRPDLAELAWFRRQAGGDRAYSLLGLIHTVAPPTLRQDIADTITAPTQPWDAIICTSPAVRANLEVLLGEWADHLAVRTGGAPPVLLRLPVIPLGVTAQRFAALADRPAVRADLRGEYGLGEDDVLVLWIGRLSYYEKAFPQPMFAAMQSAAAQTGRRLHFTLAGWFPGADDRALYERAAREHAPDVTVRFEDGNDAERLGALWAGCDVFLSLVDNIQETFGITPLEAMAAGKPVVVSDWDGYRATVRDGVDGFLVPTLGGPASGMGGMMARRHSVGIDSYQVYVGAVAQHTAVHIGRAAQALAELAASPDLRARMGQAGRERVRDTFDWPVIARQFHELVDDLAAIRAAATEPPAGRRTNPARGDPFRDFAGFASQALTPETRISVARGAGHADLQRLLAAPLDTAFGLWRGDAAECARALDLLGSGQAVTVRDVLLAFPTPRRRAVELSLMWMAKYGLIDWLD